MGTPGLEILPRSKSGAASIRYGTAGELSPDLYAVRNWMMRAGLVHSGLEVSPVPIVVAQALHLLQEDHIDLFLATQPWVKIAANCGSVSILDYGYGNCESETNRVLAFSYPWRKLNA